MQNFRISSFRTICDHQKWDKSEKTAQKWFKNITAAPRNYWFSGQPLPALPAAASRCTNFPLSHSSQLTASAHSTAKNHRYANVHTCAFKSKQTFKTITKPCGKNKKNFFHNKSTFGENKKNFFQNNRHFEEIRRIFSNQWTFWKNRRIFSKHIKCQFPFRDSSTHPWLWTYISVHSNTLVTRHLNNLPSLARKVDLDSLCRRSARDAHPPGTRSWL